jgi:hypothetical protein
MKLSWLQSTLLNAASLIAPREQRDAWLEEWYSELWYMTPSLATRACLGSFRDALWIRRNRAAEQKPPERPWNHSPAKILVLLAAVFVTGLAAAAWLTGPLAMRTSLWHFGARDLLPAYTITLSISLLLLPILMLTGQAGSPRGSLPKRGRVSRALFLLAKIIAVQPVMLCGLFICILAAPLVPVAPFVVMGSWLLILREVVADQQLRCPQCLRLLSDSIRIGAKSAIFLEWCGQESACPQGHGLLHQRDAACSCTSNGRWLSLDSSWNSLFGSGIRGLQK